MSRQFYIALSEVLGACPRKLVSKYPRDGSFYREKFHHTSDIRARPRARSPKKHVDQHVVNWGGTHLQPRRVRKRRIPNSAHTNDIPVSKSSAAISVPFPNQLRKRQPTLPLYTRTLHTFITEEGALPLKQSNDNPQTTPPATLSGLPPISERSEIQSVATDLPLPKDSHKSPTLAAELAAAVGVLMYYMGAIWFQSEYIASKYLEETNPTTGTKKEPEPTFPPDSLTPSELIHCRATFDVLTRAMDQYHTEEKLLAFYRFLRRRNFPFVESDLLHVLKASARVADWSEAIHIYEGLTHQKGGGSSIGLPKWVHGAVTKAYLRAGDIRSALSLLNAEEANGGAMTIEAYQNLIYYYTKKGEPRAAMHLLERLLAKGLHPNGAIVGMMVVLVRKDEAASQRLKQIIAASSPALQENPMMFYYLVRTAAEQGELEAGRKYLRRMRDVVTDKPMVLRTYNFLISAYEMSETDGKGCKAVVEELWEEIGRMGLKPNRASYENRLWGAVGNRDGRAFRKVWDDFRSAGFTPTERTYNARLRAAVMHGNLKRMETVFQEMIEFNVVPNPRIVTSMIAGYSTYRQTEKATQTIQNALLSGIIPDVAMFNALMHGYALSRDTESLQHWWSRMVEMGLKPNVVSYTILLQALFKSRDPDFTRIHQRIFTSEVKPDAHAFTLLYVDRLRESDMEGANEVLEQMGVQGVRPTLGTLTAMIRNELKTGDEIRAFEGLRVVLEEGRKLDSKIYEDLIRFLWKGGQFDQILTMYEAMGAEGVASNREVFHFVIRSLLKVGRVEEVGDFLRVMAGSEVGITHATFLYVFGLQEHWSGMKDREEVMDRIWNVFVNEVGWQLTCRALSKMVWLKCFYGDFGSIMKPIRDGERVGVRPGAEV
ncbi:hypothetical protein HK097_003345, partial [Rhizophlyctis rosea]